MTALRIKNFLRSRPAGTSGESTVSALPRGSTGLPASSGFASFSWDMECSPLEIAVRSFRAEQLVSKVPFHAELDAVVVERPPIGVVVPLAPLKLTACHHIGQRVVQQVDQRVLARLEVRRQLPVRVLDVQTRIADGACPLVVPRLVVER